MAWNLYDLFITDIAGYDTCVSLNALSILCSSHRMSEEDKSGSSSKALEAVPSTPAAYQASRSSPAVAKVRTLQDVQREIVKKRALFEQATANYADALSAYNAALAASDEDPNNQVLSKKLMQMTKSMDTDNSLMGAYAHFLAILVAERAELQASSRSAPEAHGHQAPGSSPAAVSNVRTLKDVQRELEKENAEYDQAVPRYVYALSVHESASAASRMDPKNKVLSEKLASAKESMDSYKSLWDTIAQRIAILQTERAQLRAVAAASSEQISKFLFCMYFGCHVVTTFLIVEMLKRQASHLLLYSMRTNFIYSLLL